MAALEVDARVAAPLAARLGHEGEEELDVQSDGLELGLRGLALDEEVAVGLAGFEVVGFSVEEDLGAFGRFGAEHGGLAGNAFELADFFTGGIVDGEDAVLDVTDAVFTFEVEDAVLEGAVAFPFFVAGFKAVTGEAVLITDRVELAVTQGDDLDAALFVLDVAAVFALECEVGIFGGFCNGDVGRFLVGGKKGGSAKAQ